MAVSMKFLAGFVWISSCTKSMAQNLGNLLNSLSIPPMRKKSCHHWARPHSHLVKKCKRSVDQFDSHFPLEHCHKLWKMLGHLKKKHGGSFVEAFLAQSHQWSFRHIYHNMSLVKSKKKIVGSPSNRNPMFAAWCSSPLQPAIHGTAA